MHTRLFIVSLFRIFNSRGAFKCSIQQVYLFLWLGKVGLSAYYFTTVISEPMYVFTSSFCVLGNSSSYLFGTHYFALHLQLRFLASKYAGWYLAWSYCRSFLSYRIILYVCVFQHFGNWIVMTPRNSIWVLKWNAKLQWLCCLEKKLVPTDLLARLLFMFKDANKFRTLSLLY